MADSSDFQRPYTPVDDPMRPEYYQARGLPLPSWLAAQLGLNPPAPAPIARPGTREDPTVGAPPPVVTTTGPAPATPTPDQLRTLLTNPTTAPQPDEKPTLDPIALAQQNQLITDVVEQARKVPGGAPTTAMLPGGTPINIQNFQPIDPATLDPVSQKFLDFARQHFDALPKVDLAQLQLPGQGFTLRGSASPEEAQLAQAFLGDSQLFPAQLERLANLIGQRYKLPEQAAWQKALRALDLAFIGTGLGLASGGAAGALLGPASGGGLGLFSGSTAGALGGILGGAVGGTWSGLASGGVHDPSKIWKNALIGGAAAGAGALASPFTTDLGSLPGGAAQSGIQGGTSAVLNWALNGGNPEAIPLSIATSAAGGGITGALSSTGLPSGLSQLVGSGGGTELKNLIQGTTGWGAPPAPTGDVAKALEEQQAYLRQLAQQQEQWKTQYAAAIAERQRLIEEQLRAANDAYESQKAEYLARLQAMLDERQQQIADALTQMGVSEGGIGSILAQFRAAADEAQQQAAADRAKTIESRQFFPSALLDQAPGTGDFATSNVLVPHSPPPVQFGEGAFPASYSGYAQAPPPTFSGEGFLPSGSVAAAASSAPPAASPLGRRRYPTVTLLNGLTRSPYLMGVA